MSQNDDINPNSAKATKIGKVTKGSKIIIDNTDTNQNTEVISIYKPNESNNSNNSNDTTNTNTNLSNELSNQVILINDLTTKINKLTKTDNKVEFINNYNQYQQKIKLIDEKLAAKSDIDPNTDIKVLFEMLNQYTPIMNTNDISVDDLKNIMDLVNIIETKIKNQKMIVQVPPEETNISSIINFQ